MSITASMVKDLREKTGVGMMECKKALEENSGDMEKAIVWLRERGMSRAAKKADRIAAEGLVEVQTNAAHDAGVVLELNCETDFVSKNDDFRAFAAAVAKLALDKKATSIQELETAKLPSGVTVKDQLTELIAKIGENMTLRRVKVLTASNGVVAGYSHMGGRIGTLVALEGVSAANIGLGKDVAMHVAASSPRYLTEAEVDQSEIEQEREIARKRLLEEGKAPDMIDKILVGQMKKFAKEICLVDQPFVKDPGMTVQKFVETSQKGAKIAGFVRFGLGEGIEKKKENFAEEVAAQMRK